jgi:dienelactone hydrolase
MRKFSERKLIILNSTTKMKKLTFYILLLISVSFGKVSAQQVFKTTTTSVIGYLEYLPQDYNANSNKYPVVIFLHGIGERGANSTDPAVLSTTILNVAKLGPPMYVKNGTQFPFILISPQLKNNYGDWPSTYVKEVIDYVKTYLRIDEKRIYLTGLSLGGGGTWWTAQDYPELFAAVAPVCGSRNTLSKACAIASEDLPVWAFHGDADPVVPYSRSVNMVNAINACTPTPNPLAKITIYPGVTHSAWNNAYKTDNTIHNPNLYQWLMSYSNTINKGNKIPVANAGVDVTRSGTGFVLTGSGSDIDGSIVSYAWSQISGPSTATLTNKITPSVTLANLVSGVYMFSLKVTDNSGNTDTDYIQVNMSANIIPVSNAGADVSVTLPLASVSITGSGSDTDGTIISYAWHKVSGPTVTLAGATTPVLNVSVLTPSTFTFRLTVKDNKGATKSDDMILTVHASTINVLPLVNAGSDKTITLPTNSVSFTGAASDSDGTITAYAWTKISGSTATLSGTTTPTLNVSALLAGSYVFRFTVTDDGGGKKYDDVSLTVLTNTTASTSNAAPVVEAGANTVVYLPKNSATITGVASDSDGTIVSYQWSKAKGGTATLTNASTPTVTITDLQEGSYYFRLTVKDNTGAIAYDDMLLTVKAALTTSSTSRTSSLTIMDENPDLTDDTMLASSLEEKPRLSLADISNALFENSTVTVFNDSGQKVYTGSWTEESYREVFSKRGLYIYNVIKENKRIDSGKIVVRN